MLASICIPISLDVAKASYDDVQKENLVFAMGFGTCGFDLSSSELLVAILCARQPGGGGIMTKVMTMVVATAMRVATAMSHIGQHTYMP